jgi:hypothetical protein
MASRTTARRVTKAMLARREQVLRLSGVVRQRWTAKTGFPHFGSRVPDAGRAMVVCAHDGIDYDCGVWNLWRDGATASLLTEFSQDRGATKVKYVDGWTPREESMGLAFGSCVHDVFEATYDLFQGLSHDTIMTGITTGEPIKQYIAEYDQKWRAEHPDPSTEALQQQQMVYGYAKAVLPSYFKRWIGDFTGQYTFMPNTVTHPKKFLATEGEFRVAYTYPDGLQVWLRGKRDLLFLDKAGNEWVQDTKCLSVIQDKEILRFFPIDLQQNLYILARFIENIRAGRVDDAMPAGCIKNIVRRPGHHMRKDEPLPDFFTRVAKDVSDPKQWDVKDKKGTTGWFVRYEMQMSEAELLNWVENWLDPLMMDLRLWHDGVTPNYSTERGLSTKYGPSDAFAPIVDGNFNSVYRRIKPFPELAAA